MGGGVKFFTKICTKYLCKLYKVFIFASNFVVMWQYALCFDKRVLNFI